MLTLNELRELCFDESIALTKHAKNRLKERGISIDNIKHAIQSGEIIMQYEDDKPFPSCLVLGSTEQHKTIHIVASIDNDYLYIITAYYPNENEWEADFKTRRERK